MFTMRLPEGTSYVPSLLEVAIAFAVPAAAGLIYFLFAENLAVLVKTVPEHQPDPYAKPQFSQGTYLHVEDSLSGTIARRSGLAALVVALTVAVLPADIVTGQSLPQTPIRAAQGWEMLVINGDRNQNRVDFDHLTHQEQLWATAAGDEDICLTCHHLSKPNDEATACWECHQDMHQPTSIFDHRLHQLELGGNASCIECHLGEHTAATAKPCADCHETMAPQTGEVTFNYLASGYEDAMHGTCLTCHEQEAEARGKPELEQCSACHKLGRKPVEAPLAVQSAAQTP
jgi:hypothetical protein